MITTIISTRVIRQLWAVHHAALPPRQFWAAVDKMENLLAATPDTALDHLMAVLS